MGKLEIKCIICNAKGGVDEDLDVRDFGKDAHGSIICKFCHSSPKDAVINRMAEATHRDIPKNMTVATAQERAAEAKRRATRRGIG